MTEVICVKRRVKKEERAEGILAVTVFGFTGSL
jgi:hypothetical protein